MAAPSFNLRPSSSDPFAEIGFFNHRGFPSDRDEIQATSRKLVSITIPHVDVEKPQAVVNFSFQINLPREQFHLKIRNEKNLKVVFWYVGPYGLKKMGVEYYKQDLGLIHSNPDRTEAVLYDLTAWAAVKNKNVTIQTQSSHVQKINQLGLKNIWALPSSEFFLWLQDLSEPDKGVRFIQNLLAARKFIYKNSDSFTPNEIKIRELFTNRCLSLESIFTLDTAQGYSVLQYIELLYFVELLVKKAVLSGEKKVVICFALPNDEWKYYHDSQNFLEKDIQQWVAIRFGGEVREMEIRIELCTVPFGDGLKDRPYLAGREIVKKVDRADLI